MAVCAFEVALHATSVRPNRRLNIIPVLEPGKLAEKGWHMAHTYSDSSALGKNGACPPELFLLSVMGFGSYIPGREAEGSFLIVA